VKIEFADHCAWRAFYVSRANTSDGYGRHQFLHLGIDPSTSSSIGPALFGGVVNPWNRRGWAFHWRVKLPCVRWKCPASPLRRWLYGLSSRFWHGLDGRYGWGRK
jgi:hypothetical protein